MATSQATQHNNSATEDMSSFYITGGTLSTSAASYVVRTADNLLLTSLLKGEFCYVLNTRQMGKSSLMARTARLLRDEGKAVAVLDLTAIGQNLSISQWYFGLLERAGQQLGLVEQFEAYWERRKELGPMQRFLEVLCKVAIPAINTEVIVFIDEVDALRSLPFSTDELFAGIRELYNRRTIDTSLNLLTFCLLGVATPDNLIRDTRTTPFNIGTRIDLYDFTEKEAEPLAQGIVGSKAVLERVLYWTGGHPYLTQRLCRAIADEPNDIRPRDVDRLCEKLFLSRRARETEDNLLFVRERILRSDHDLPALLLLYMKMLRPYSRLQDDPTDRLVSALKLAGLVKADQTGNLAPRNRIYQRVFNRQWIDDNMPGAELRRQKHAFWRGAIRWGGAGLAFGIIVASLAFIELRQEQRAEMQLRRYENLLYISDMQNAQTAYDSSDLGRLRHLLTQTASLPERGFEWYYWNNLAYPSSIMVNPGDGPLQFCRISTNGTRLLTGGANGMLRLWDTRTLHQILAVKYPGSTLATGQFNGSGSRFDAKDPDGGLTIYDSRTGAQIYSIAPNEAGTENDTTWDMSAVITVTAKVGVRIIDAKSGRTVLTLPQTGQVSDGAPASLSDAYAAVTEEPFAAYLCRNGPNHALHTVSIDISRHIASRQDVQIFFSNNDRDIVTFAGTTGSIDIWSAMTGQFIRHLTNVNAVSALVMPNPYLPITIIADDGLLKEYSTETGAIIKSESSPIHLSGFVPSDHFSNDGKLLSFFGTNGSVFYLNCVSLTRSKIYLCHSSAVVGMEFLPGDSAFITASSDGTVQRWSVHTDNGSDVHTVRFPGQQKFAGIFVDADAKYGATYDLSGNVSSWSIQKDVARDEKKLGKRILPFVFSDNLEFLTNQPRDGSPDAVDDLITGKVVTPQVGDSYFTASAISSTGERFADSSLNAMISVFDVRSSQKLWSARVSNDYITSISFSPSGRLLVTGGDSRSIDIWSAASGAMVRSLHGGDQAINAVSIDPTDRYVVAATNSSTIYCWSISTGKLLWQAENPGGPVSSFNWDSTGSRLICCGNLGEAEIWNAPSGDLLLRVYTAICPGIAKFSADGSKLYVTGFLGKYQVCSTRSDRD